MKVRNMIGHSGQPVKNQSEIEDDQGNRYFQSYNTIIVALKGRNVYLDHNWDYSSTTGKYRNLYLGETRKETKEKIKEGIYTVTKLN